MLEFAKAGLHVGPRQESTPLAQTNARARAETHAPAKDPEAEKFVDDEVLETAIRTALAGNLKAQAALTDIMRAVASMMAKAGPGLVLDLSNAVAALALANKSLAEAYRMIAPPLGRNGD